MKPLFYISSIALLALLAACDDVAPENRTYPIERPPVSRKVLIQEFSGQLCTNCPEGAAKVASLIENYPDGIVATTLQPENTAFTRPLGPVILTSPAATAYYAAFNPPAFPAAVINGSQPNISVQSWGTIVRDMIAIDAPAAIRLTPTYDPSTRTASVDYEVEFNVLYSSPVNITVQLVESGIVAPQFTMSAPIMDYVHNHILRTCLTPVWGEPLGSDFAISQTLSGTCTTVLDTAWVPENCAIVAYISDPATLLVHQAEETHLIHDNNTNN